MGGVCQPISLTHLTLQGPINGCPELDQGLSFVGADLQSSHNINIALNHRSKPKSGTSEDPDLAHTDFVAGQIVFSPGYLSEVYRHVRVAGGVCIAAELQVGFGRLCTHFWGFDTQRAIPDTV